jgi:hypothetical protein
LAIAAHIAADRFKPFPEAGLSFMSVRHQLAAGDLIADKTSPVSLCGAAALGRTD